jgi:DNA repair photolyase
MRTIYEPTGAAKEYAPLALSLYRGCTFSCSYCFCPSVLRMSRKAFHSKAEPRKNIINELEKYLTKNAEKIKDKPVLISFMHDPYQPAEEKYHATREAIELLVAHKRRIRLLTKAPNFAAERDGRFLLRNEADFGTTLTGISDEQAKCWEPKAELPSIREKAIQDYRRLGDDMPFGIFTWLSMEPVLDIEGALATLRRLVGKVDRIMIGRWNHDTRANKMNWTYFLSEAMKILLPTDQRFYIKNALWNSCARGVLFNGVENGAGWLKERR